MAIDNPKEKFEQQYMREPEKSLFDLAIFGGKLAFPKAALPLEIFQKVRDRLTRASIDERLQTMWDTLVKEVEHVESTKADKEEMERAIHLVMWRAIEELDDRKRERYVKLIGNALKSQDQIRDVVSFVQTIEHLTERDLIVLKVMNEVMNTLTVDTRQRTCTRNPNQFFVVLPLLPLQSPPLPWERFPARRTPFQLHLWPHVLRWRTRNPDRRLSIRRSGRTRWRGNSKSARKCPDILISYPMCLR